MGAAGQPRTVVAYRRFRIAQMTMEGKTYEEIGEELGMSPPMVHEEKRTLELAWAALARASLNQVKWKLYSELEDLKSVIWERYVDTTTSGSTGSRTELSALGAIRQLIEDQRKITGVDAPAQVRSMILNLTPDEIRSLPEEKLDQLIDSLGIKLEAIEGNGI